MKLTHYIVLFILICLFLTPITAQDRPAATVKENDTLFQSINKLSQSEIGLDTIDPNIDTLGLVADSLAPRDTLAQLDTIPNQIADEIKFADEPLPEPIQYGARDTQWYDHKNKLMHLYGNAFVNYDGMDLKAGYIILNIENNVAEAMTIDGPSGERAQPPTFNDGTKEIIYDHLKYNFKSKKGIVYEAISTEGDMYLHGAKTKFVGADESLDRSDDVIYNANTLITACSHEHPHYGFRTKKLKIIPDKIAVIGPANLELGGVPTPLVIPYGFFPLVSNKSSGFIFPQNYEYSPNLGFGLMGFGWYFPINDYLDLTVTANAYTRGTFGINAISNYKKKYKYTGLINLGYNDQRVETPGDLEINSRKSIKVFVRHKQDNKAHPYSNIGGSINVQTENYQQVISNRAEDILENSYTSNFDFSHDLPGSAYRFVFGFQHSQNTRSHDLNITLPKISMKMNRIFPFQQKNKGGNDEKWFEKISFKHDFDLKNTLITTDSTLFEKETLENLQTGIQQKIALSSSSFKLFEYLNITPDFSYDEIWTLKQKQEYQGSEQVQRLIEVDSIMQADGSYIPDSIFEIEDSIFIVEDFVNKFTTYRNYTAGVSMNTKLFGTLNFKKGWLRGVRHTVDPTLRFNVAPDTRSIWTDTLYTSLDTDGFREYNRLVNRPFNQRLTDKQMALDFSIKNQLEFKYYSKKDSTYKKFKIFDSVNMRSGYNFIADSLKIKPITVDATSRFFKNISSLTFKATYDPFVEAASGRQIKTTTWEAEGKLVRLDYMLVKLSNRISIKQLKDIFVGGAPDRTKTKEEERREFEEEMGVGLNSDLESEFGPQELEPKKEKRKEKKEEIGFIDWLGNIKIAHEYQYEMRTMGEEVNPRFTHTLNFQGNINITENWTLRIGNFGYDFINKGLTYPAFNFGRKLHCWDMTFSWEPRNGTYSFFIGVRNSSLNFLKYNYGQNNVDGLIGRIN